LQEQRDNGTRRSWSYDPASPWTPLAAIEQADGGPQADIYWLHADLNSAPLEVTDADGHLRWSGQYDTFGRLKGQTIAGAALREGATYDQPLRYAGQYEDAESGLHYNLFRYYDPEVGRFTVQDPIGLNGGLNLYAYAPNPLGWVDPLGLYRGEGERSLGKYHVFHEHTLDSSEYTMTDKEHFSRANESVYRRLQMDPEFKRTMQTKYPGVVKHVQPSSKGAFRGSSPPEMTWHHGDAPGSLQLVDRPDHRDYHKIYHPDGLGGRNKWGGGTSCRR
ncbi:RHS repeat-associated core domain-containing protein, partial [Pluralibacter gergoviae]|uniref:RHS repeat-associated core domain-containing protein n=1 Tax=Pluralibacter gergoviae TaxID=61647 RepID=UPI000B63BF5D